LQKSKTGSVAFFAVDLIYIFVDKGCYFFGTRDQGFQAVSRRLEAPAVVSRRVRDTAVGVRQFPKRRQDARIFVKRGSILSQYFLQPLELEIENRVVRTG